MIDFSGIDIIDTEIMPVDGMLPDLPVDPDYVEGYKFRVFALRASGKNTVVLTDLDMLQNTQTLENHHQGNRMIAMVQTLSRMLITPSPERQEFLCDLVRYARLVGVSENMRQNGVGITWSRRCPDLPNVSESKKSHADTPACQFIATVVHLLKTVKVYEPSDPAAFEAYRLFSKYVPYVRLANLPKGVVERVIGAGF
jgi:hypothetical protein